MANPQAELEALATRLQEAAARLKAAGPAAGEDPRDGPDDEGAGSHGARDERPGEGGRDEEPSSALLRLEAVGAAVRDARRSLAAIEARLGGG